jgi:hypothetical protein
MKKKRMVFHLFSFSLRVEWMGVVGGGEEE